MAWTTPRDWVADENVTATIMNTHVRDNLNYLLSSRPTYVNSDSGVNSTTSTSFVDMDAASISAEITPKSSRVLVILSVYLNADNTASNSCTARITGDNGAGSSAQVVIGQNLHHFVTLAWIFTGLSADTTYTFTGQYKAATGTVYAGSSGGTRDGAMMMAMEV